MKILHSVQNVMLSGAKHLFSLIQFVGIKNNTYICMPEVFRLFGFTYFFFSREHKPIHVQIEGAEGYAVYELEGEDFVQRYSRGIKAGDLKRIENVLKENKDTITETWEAYFKRR